MRGRIPHSCHLVGDAGWSLLRVFGTQADVKPPHGTIGIIRAHMLQVWSPQQARQFHLTGCWEGTLFPQWESSWSTKTLRRHMRTNCFLSGEVIGVHALAPSPVDTQGTVAYTMFSPRIHIRWGAGNNFAPAGSESTHPSPQAAGLGHSNDRLTWCVLQSSLQKPKSNCKVRYTSQA